MGLLDRGLTPSGKGLAGGIATLVKAVAFLMRPRVFITFLAILFLIALGEHMHAAILVPVVLALLYLALRLRLRGE